MAEAGVPQKLNTARGPAAEIAETLTPNYHTTRNFSYSFIPEQDEFQNNLKLMTTLHDFEQESNRITRSPGLYTQSDIIA